MAPQNPNRNYKKETAYENSPEQVARRVARNKARRKALKAGTVHKGDNKEVDHQGFHRTGSLENVPDKGCLKEDQPQPTAKEGWMSDYTVITTDECPWCTKATNLLSSLELPYTEYDLADHVGIRDFFNRSEFKTVPQIFHKGKHIGGFSQLKFYLGE